MSCWTWDSTIERQKIPANGTQVLNKCNALISKYISHKENYCYVHRHSKPRIKMAMEMTICCTCKRNQGKKIDGRTWINQPNSTRTWPTRFQRHEILIPKTEKIPFPRPQEQSPQVKSNLWWSSFELPKEV